MLFTKRKIKGNIWGKEKQTKKFQNLTVKPHIGCFL